jgi:hypothetical protein
MLPDVTVSDRLMVLSTEDEELSDLFLTLLTRLECNDVRLSGSRD